MLKYFLTKNENGSVFHIKGEDKAADLGFEEAVYVDTDEDKAFLSKFTKIEASTEKELTIEILKDIIENVTSDLTQKIINTLAWNDVATLVLVDNAINVVKNPDRKKEAKGAFETKVSLEVLQKAKKSTTYTDLAEDEVFKSIINNKKILLNVLNKLDAELKAVTGADATDAEAAAAAANNRKKFLLAFVDAKKSLDKRFKNPESFYLHIEECLNRDAADFAKCLININHEVLKYLWEKDKSLPLDKSLESILNYNQTTNPDTYKDKTIKDLNETLIETWPSENILKIKDTDWGKIKTLTQKVGDGYQKNLVQELIFGKKKKGAGNGYIHSLIKPGYIEDFCDFYEKNIELVTKLPQSITLESDDDFHKNYLVAKFLEHKQIKDGKESRMNWFSKFQSSEDTRGCRGNISWYYSNFTIKNNEAFLDNLLEIKKEHQFIGKSERKLKNGKGELADNNALSSIAIDYAKCSSHADKQVYRRAFYETLELLGCGKIKHNENHKDTRFTSINFIWESSAKIPCSPDEFSLLVNALIAERRGGYNINQLRAILKDPTATQEEKILRIHGYCEDNKNWLLDRQKFNQKLLGSSSYFDGPRLSGVFGGSLRMGFNNAIGYAITAINSISYCFESYPSASVKKAEAREMEKGLASTTDRR